MRRLMTTMAAAAVAAVAAAATAAEAVPLTSVPDGSQLANSGYCDASAGCPTSYPGSPAGWMAYDVFTLAQAATVTDFGFYSYFDGATAADYVSTNWSIWEISGSEAQPSTAVVDTTTSVGVIPPGANSDPILVTVDNLSVSLAAGTYWIGFQNNLSAGYSTYATTDGDSSVYFGQIEPDFTAARYKQLAFYLYGTNDAGGAPPTTSVAEPSTWAMTLFGFAGLGWLARGRVGPPRFLTHPGSA